MALGWRGLGSLAVGCKRGKEQLIEDKGSDKTAGAVAVDAGGVGETVGGNDHDLHWALRRCTCVALGELRSCFGRPWLLGHLAANEQSVRCGTTKGLTEATICPVGARDDASLHTPIGPIPQFQGLAGAMEPWDPP